MTIVQAIQTVLKDAPEGLTANEIYQSIIRDNLYKFGAKDPVGVVNNQLRRRCADLEFASAHPSKLFQIIGQREQKHTFALYHKEAALAAHTAPEEPAAPDILSPGEKVSAALAEHLSSIRRQVLDAILKQNPAFFERLVVTLLLKMGYGPDDQAGVVTRASHDGGIDGIISEDRLGLGLIYLQAKRYAPQNKIGRRTLQEFVGAMEHISKGIFITTSSFTKEALSYIDKQQQKSIKLIDGQFLSELLVRYEVGVCIDKTVSIYKIDAGFFRTGS